MTNDPKTRMDSLKARIRIEKIVATRSLKTNTGDIFCGLSASFKHDGMGPGVDLLTNSEEDTATSQQGLSAHEISPAYLYLQHRAYLMCLESAVAEGALPEKTALNLKNEANTAFATRLALLLRVPETNDSTDRGG